MFDNRPGPAALLKALREAGYSIPDAACFYVQTELTFSLLTKMAEVYKQHPELLTPPRKPSKK